MKEEKITKYRTAFPGFTGGLIAGQRKKNRMETARYSLYPFGFAVRPASDY